MEQQPWPWEENVEEELLPEEPIPRIVLEEVEREAKRIVEEYGLSSVTEQAESTRDKLASKRMLRELEKWGAETPCTLALDTGFTSPPLELTGGGLVVVIRSHVFHGCRETGELPPSGSVGFMKFTDTPESSATPLSKVYEREFIKKILEMKREGKLDVDIVIVDGEVFPRVPPGLHRRGRLSSTRTTGPLSLYVRILDLTRQILSLARETDTALLGVIKRSYGHDVAVKLLDRNIRLNDKALATMMLKPGEYIDLGDYGELAKSLEAFIEKFKKELDETELTSLRERLSWMQTVITCVPDSARVRIAVYKAWSPSYFMISTKTELWPSRKYPVEKLLSYTASITGVNGVPHPIDLVDNMASVRADLLYLIQQKLLQALTRITGDRNLALSIAGLTNPEKMRHIGLG